MKHLFTSRNRCKCAAAEPRRTTTLVSPPAGECRDSAQVPLPPGASAAAASISHQQGAGSGGGAAPAASAGSAQHARRWVPLISCND